MHHGDGLFERSPAHIVQASDWLNDYPQIVLLSDGVIDNGSVSHIDFGDRYGCRCIAFAQGIREAKLLTLLNLEVSERLLPDCTEVSAVCG